MQTVEKILRAYENLDKITRINFTMRILAKIFVWFLIAVLTPIKPVLLLFIAVFLMASNILSLATILTKHPFYSKALYAIEQVISVFIFTSSVYLLYPAFHEWFAVAIIPGIIGITMEMGMVRGLVIVGLFVPSYSLLYFIMPNAHDPLHYFFVIPFLLVTFAMTAQLTKEIEKLAIVDSLTKVYNQRYFHNRLKVEFKKASRYNRSLSLILIDIDDFKQVNDKYGHLFGDEVLREVSEAIRKSVRDLDTVARYGGEEFVVIMPETTTFEYRRVAERLRKSIANLSKTSTGLKGRKITASIGVSIFPHDGAQPDEIIKKADLAMYKAKRLGKNKVAVA